MNKPRATTAGENKHTSTEAHMSKVEVKVKKGDRWTTSSGMLFQVRGNDDQLIIDNDGTIYSTSDEDWEKGDMFRAIVPEEVARLWINACGGTVVEEREEAVPSTLTVKIYRSTHDGSLWMIDSPTHAAPSGYAFIGTTTIHIAGVTA